MDLQCVVIPAKVDARRVGVNHEDGPGSHHQDEHEKHERTIEPATMHETFSPSPFVLTVPAGSNR